MAKNLGKKGDKKGAYVFEDSIGLPKMPNLGAMLNPFPSLEPLASLALTSKLLSDSTLPRTTLGAFSSVSKLNDAITAHGTAMRALGGDAAAKFASSATTGSFSHLKTLMTASPSLMATGGSNSILLPSLSKNLFTNRLAPPIPSTPQLTSLGSSFSSTMAALRAIDDSFRNLTQMQDRISGEARAFSTVMQSFMQSSSLLSKHISEFQRTIAAIRRTQETLRTFTEGFRFPRNMATAELLSSSFLTAQDIIDSESLLQDNFIGKSGYANSESELTRFIFHCLDLPSSAIRWLLTNNTFRWALITILLGIPSGMMSSYIIDELKAYPIVSISEQTIAFKNEMLPDNRLGRIKLGKHTLYRDPTKLSDPIREVSENQKVILHDEEVNGWRKVSVAIEDNGGWLVCEGWIEEQGYDAIP